MDDSNWIWIVVGLLVLLAILAFAISSARKRRDDKRRVEAGRIREEATHHERDLREREAEADEAEARARRARAEADERDAAARRLEVAAERRSDDRDHLRDEHDERLRRADALDPDVPTDRDGRRLDGNGRDAGAGGWDEAGETREYRDADDETRRRIDADLDEWERHDADREDEQGHGHGIERDERADSAGSNGTYREGRTIVPESIERTEHVRRVERVETDRIDHERPEPGRDELDPRG